MIFSENRYPPSGIHALEHFAAATAAVDQPGGGRAGYGRADPDLQIFRAITGMAPRAAAAPLCVSPCASGTAVARRINTAASAAPRPTTARKSSCGIQLQARPAPFACG